jgi:hypothetical protein
MVESLVADAPRLAQMRRHAALYGRPDAALAVADIVLNTINRAMPYGNYETRSRQ